VTAQLTVGDDLTSSAVTAEIDMASVSTGNTDRDTHLASTDFFGAENNPKMTFVSTDISGAGEEYKLTGDLTLNGITKPVELDVEFFGTSVFPMDQSTRAGFTATGSLSRKDYGIEFNVALGGDKVMISDKVALELDIQLVGPSA
jgi:polyisoprenoid-binding protein YceI